MRCICLTGDVTCLVSSGPSPPRNLNISVDLDDNVNIVHLTWQPPVHPNTNKLHYTVRHAVDCVVHAVRISVHCVVHTARHCSL